MRLYERIERLPVEDWAASAAAAFRRLRRRAARRRALILGVAGGGMLVAAVAGNALFGQTAPHPAPLWGGADREMAVAAHGGPAEEVADTVEVSPLVAEIQEGLAGQGFFSGTASGILDEATRTAIRIFERTQGLPETGDPSVALLAAVSAGVKAVPQPEPLPRLSVADMQRLLNDRGFGPLDVDGLMGPRTRAAIERFAVSQGIDPSDPRSPALMRALAQGGA